MLKRLDINVSSDDGYVFSNIHIIKWSVDFFIIFLYLIQPEI